MAKQLKLLAVPLMLLGIVVITRVPFLSNTLVGEEGTLAAFVLSKEPLSKQASDGLPRIMIGTVDGKPVLITAERTIVPYIIIEKLGRLVSNQNEQMSFAERSRSARLPFFCFFMMGIVGLFVILVSEFEIGEPRRVWACVLIVLFALTTPLAVGSSIQPQLDGSVGVMLLGLAAWILVSLAKEKFRLPAFAMAGFFIGLGKHEWAIAFVISIFCILALDKFRTRATRVSISLLVGISIGIAISLLISFDDYLLGFGLMNRIYGSEHRDLTSWFYHQGKYLWPVVILLLTISLVLLKNLRYSVENKTGLLVVFLGSIFIMFGFSLSGWPGDGFPRYFVTSLVLALYALLSIFQDRSYFISKTQAALIIVVMGFGIVLNVIELRHSYVKHLSISSSPGLSLSELENRFKHDAANSKDGVLFEDSAVWVYFPSINFMSSALGVEGARHWLDSVVPGENRRLIVQ